MIHVHKELSSTEFILNGIFEDVNFEFLEFTLYSVRMCTVCSFISLTSERLGSK